MAGRSLTVCMSPCFRYRRRRRRRGGPVTDCMYVSLFPLQTAEAAARRAERQQVKQLLVGLFPTVNADQLDVVSTRSHSSSDAGGTFGTGNNGKRSAERRKV